MGIVDQVATMALAEKRELAEALRRAIAEGLAASACGEPDRRPRCGRPSFVRKRPRRLGRPAAAVPRLTHLESRPLMSCVNRWTIGERYGYVSTLV